VSGPCPASFFGGAAAYNVFLSGNPSVQYAFNLTNGDVWGKVAVAGSFFARNFGVGTRISCTGNASSDATLIVSGSAVDFTGAVDCGNLVTPATTTVRGVNFNNGKAVTGDIFALTGLNFSAVASSIASASSSLCSSSGGIAATVGSGNRITLGSTSSASQLTFTLTTAQLASASSIRFALSNVAAVEQIVVNVVGDGAVDFSGFDTDLGGLSNGVITWNICSATSVSISAFNFQGNLLAPLADVTLNNAQINGNVAARTLSGTGSGEVHAPVCP
jgi:choice-of-anchor A domain-containing protein